MKHLKTFNKFNESIFDIFKKDDDDKIALEFIERFRKVKEKNPYNIILIGEDNSDQFPSWTNKFSNLPDSERYSISYLVRFDDVDLLITNDHNDLVFAATGEPAGVKMCKYPWKLYIAEERVYAKEKYREKIFKLVENIYKSDIKRKRIEKITTEINPAADRL